MIYPAVLHPLTRRILPVPINSERTSSAAPMHTYRAIGAILLLGGRAHINDYCYDISFAAGPVLRAQCEY